MYFWVKHEALRMSLDYMLQNLTGLSKVACDIIV